MVACIKGTSSYTNIYTLFLEILMLQLLPNVSFYGHFAGFLSGYLYAQDYFKFIETPLADIGQFVVSKLEPFFVSDENES